MILALAATQIEMQPFLLQLPEGTQPCLTLVTGVGPMETSCRLMQFLCRTEAKVDMVINFGIGGVYLQPDACRQPTLLDICFAEREVMGDLGICLHDGVEYLDRSLTGDTVFPLDAGLLARSREILAEDGRTAFSGTFVTVNAATATRRRGEMLQARWQGLCENMEGAAIARVCREFTLPCLEMRAVSNMVEDRNPENWRLREACCQAARSAALIVGKLSA